MYYYKRKFNLTAAVVAVILCAISLTCVIRAENIGDNAPKTPEEIEIAKKCLTDRWYASGGVLITGGDGALVFEVSDTDPFIETTELRYNNFTNANALRLRLINGAGCKSVTLYYTTYASPDFSGERSRTVELSAATGVQTAYLPVPSDYVGQLRIVFAGELRGDIKILSLVPVSTYISNDNGYAEVTSCKETSSDTIKIEGALTEAALYKLRGYELELYELDCWQDADAATLSALRPVDSSAAVHSFVFEIPLYRGDGTSRINSKFAVVAWRDGVPLLLDGYKYISNPEHIALIETENERSALIKGASPAESAGSLIDSGTAQTVIEVSLPKLMTLTGSGVTFISDGAVYAANNDYVSALDASIRRSTESGIRVYLRLTTSATGSSSENRVFSHPASVPSAVYTAFNTETASGVAYLRAACEFLASRYSADNYPNGRVQGYIIGCGVENANKYYNLGEASLADFIKAYGSALRIAYNAVRVTAGAGPEVFIALGSTWNAELTSDSRLTYDAKSVIDALDAMCGEEGEMGWQLAFDPYPEENGYLAYKDTAAGSDYLASRITLANIDLLCGYLMRQQLYYNGVSRQILLCERPAAAAPKYPDKTAATADYIYASYKLSGVKYSIVSGFIITHAASLEDEAYRLVDTQLAPDITDKYKQTLGITEWRELIPAFDESTAVKRNIFSCDLISSPPDKPPTGKYTLWKFERSISGWMGTLGCESLSGGNTFNGREGLLRMRLSPYTGSVITLNEPVNAADDIYAGIYNDFEYKLDLSSAPLLGFEIQLAAMPDGVNGAELTLILSDGKNTAYASGIVTSGRWNTVYADFSGFTGIRDCTRMMIILHGEKTTADGVMSYTDIGEPVVMLGPITAHSAQYSDAELAKSFEDAREAALAPDTRHIDVKLVWATVVVILAALSLWTIYIMARIRGRK